MKYTRHPMGWGFGLVTVVMVLTGLTEDGARARSLAADPDTPLRTVAEIVDAADKSALLGRRALLTGVVVARRVNDQSFVATDAAGREIVVVLPGTEPAPAVGRSVDVDGHVRETPGLSPWELKPAPSWGRATSGIFVAAGRVTLSGDHERETRPTLPRS